MSRQRLPRQGGILLMPRMPKHEMKSIPRRKLARLRCAHALSGPAGRGMREPVSCHTSDGVFRDPERRHGRAQGNGHSLVKRGNAALKAP